MGVNKGKDKLMLGFFKRKQRKEFEIDCPVCGREYLYKHAPEEITKFNYKYKEGTGFVCSLECDFCGAEASVIQYPSGELDTVDNKWVKLEREHTREMDGVRSEMAAMKALLEKTPDNKMQFQLAQLENKLEKLERIFDIQVNKYKDFQKEWREEWQSEMLKK